MQQNDQHVMHPITDRLSFRGVLARLYLYLTLFAWPSAWSLKQVKQCIGADAGALDVKPDDFQAAFSSGVVGALTAAQQVSQRKHFSRGWYGLHASWSKLLQRHSESTQRFQSWLIWAACTMVHACLHVWLKLWQQHSK